MSEESRLGREAIETAYALKQLVQAGVRVFFYLEDRERTLDSPTDKIMLSLTAFADELEREKARQRTYDAMIRKAKAGHVTGGACFGYRNVEIDGADGQRSHVERAIDATEADDHPADLPPVGRGPRRQGDREAAERRAGAVAAGAAGTVAIVGAVVGPGGALPAALSRRDCLEPDAEARYVGPQASDRPPGVRTGSADPAPDLRIVSEAEWDAAHARLTRGAGHLPARQQGADVRPAGAGESVEVPADESRALRVLRRIAQGALAERTATAGSTSMAALAITIAGGRSARTGRRADERRRRHRDRGAARRRARSRRSCGMPSTRRSSCCSGTTRPIGSRGSMRTSRRSSRSGRGSWRRLPPEATSARLLDALRTRDERRRRLEAERATVAAQAPLRAADAARVRAELLALASSWRQVLVAGATHARPIVTALLKGRVTITPMRRSGVAGSLRGEGSLGGLFAESDFSTRCGVPNGIRTRVLALKGPRPGPLDDGDRKG